MRCIFRGGFLKSNYCKNSLDFHRVTTAGVQLFCRSGLSKSSNRVRKSKKDVKDSNFSNLGEMHESVSLFNEILEILGAENIWAVKHGPFASNETQMKRGDFDLESLPCLRDVCENADEKIEPRKLETLSVMDAGKNGISEEIESKDVSPIVHKMTEIIRGDHDMISMEEKLDDSCFEYNAEVVEKALKRCFKVPHLGLRFFNWVKSGKEFQHTVNTFCTVVNLAAEMKEFGLVDELMEDLQKSPYAKNVKPWTVLLSHYGKAKLIGKSLLVFEKMKNAGVEPDGIAYRTMLSSLCISGKADLASEFYKEMVNREVDIDVGLYKQLLKCFALHGDVAAVHEVGANMIKLSEIPETRVYGIMLKSLCIAGRIKAALELIRHLKTKDLCFDNEVFVDLVKGLCCTGRIVDALEIFEIVKKKQMPDRQIHEILIGSYLGRNEWSKAFDLFQDMKKFGDVSVNTYTKLMQHFFTKNDFQKGMELYDEMIRLGIQLDSLAITVVAASYVRQNHISEAWNVFKSMNEKGIKATSKEYSIFIKELCNVSQTNEIIKVLNEMQVLQVNIRSDNFERVLSYLEKKGETEKLEAVKRMQRACMFYHRGKAVEPNIDTWNYLEPVEQAKIDQVEQERVLQCLPLSVPQPCVDHGVLEISQILSSSEDWCLIQEKLEKCTFGFMAGTVTEILHYCRMNGGNALKFFSWVGKKTGYTHTAKSYNMAIKIAGQGKDFKHMRSLFYEMKRRGFLLTADTWTIMIMQYGRTGLTNIALSNFRDMKLSGCKPTKSTYSSLITSLCGKKGRKVDEAISIYQEMVRVGCIPDKKMIETYLGCLCEASKLTDARSCVESLLKCGFTISLAYSLYFRALCRAGKLEDALSLVDEVDGARYIINQYTYGSLIHCLLRRGLLEESLEKIEAMRRIGVFPTVHIYTSLIIHFFNVKEINRALETLEDMKKAGCHPTIITYSALICGYVRSGLLTDAWNMFGYIKQNGPAPDFKTYSMFISCLCRVGESEEALKLISEMMSVGIIPSTINFQKVVYGLNREGKTILAQNVLKKKLDLKRRRKLNS